MSEAQSKNHDDYTPPAVWNWEDLRNQNSGGKFNNTNRPTAGAQHDQVLPRGNNPLQLYSLNTPNGIKVNILLQELAALGIEQAAFDAYKINIMDGDQFGSDFVSYNPNSKIPVLVDQSQTPDIAVFESGAILLYLAEKFQRFYPTEHGHERAQCQSWLMWQMGSAPYLGGGFGHFYAYAPKPMEYPINRFTMETKRQLDVLDQHLAEREFLCDHGYSIADMAVWPWYGLLALGKIYEAGEFLQVDGYRHVQRWAKSLYEREAVSSAVELELIPIKDS